MIEETKTTNDCVADGDARAELINDSVEGVTPKQEYAMLLDEFLGDLNKTPKRQLEVGRQYYYADFHAASIPIRIRAFTVTGKTERDTWEGDLALDASDLPILDWQNATGEERRAAMRLVNAGKWTVKCEREEQRLYETIAEARREAHRRIEDQRYCLWEFSTRVRSAERTLLRWDGVLCVPHAHSPTTFEIPIVPGATQTSEECRVTSECVPDVRAEVNKGSVKQATALQEYATMGDDSVLGELHRVEREMYLENGLQYYYVDRNSVSIPIRIRAFTARARLGYDTCEGDMALDAGDLSMLNRYNSSEEEQIEARRLVDAGTWTVKCERSRMELCDTPEEARKSAGDRIKEELNALNSALKRVRVLEETLVRWDGVLCAPGGHSEPAE